jgi:hypothetical protein
MVKLPNKNNMLSPVTIVTANAIGILQNLTVPEERRWVV